MAAAESWLFDVHEALGGHMIGPSSTEVAGNPAASGEVVYSMPCRSTAAGRGQLRYASAVSSCSAATDCTS